MSTLSITVSGIVAGRLWWPVGTPASLPVNAEILRSDEDVFPASGPYPDLRTALVELLCTGDVSSAGFLPGSLVIVVRRRGKCGRTRTRAWTVRGRCSETDDVFAKEEFAAEFG